jgi:hypothetical protein
MIKRFKEQPSVTVCLPTMNCERCGRVWMPIRERGRADCCSHQSLRMRPAHLERRRDALLGIQRLRAGDMLVSPRNSAIAEQRDAPGRLSEALRVASGETSVRHEHDLRR